MKTLKQINIKFNEANPVDMKVYHRIKTEPKITEYIRQLVLNDMLDDMYRLMYREGVFQNGEKD